MKKSKFGAVFAGLLAFVMLAGCGTRQSAYNDALPPLEVVPAQETASEEYEDISEESFAEENFSEENFSEEVLEEITEEPTEASADKKQALQSEEYKQQYYFRNKKTRDSHFEKHGDEFGGQYQTAEEYETGADRAAHDPNALHKLEKEDKDDVYYIEATNEFVIISTDGYIRTYFKPSAGKKYFDRQ